MYIMYVSCTGGYPGMYVYCIRTYTGTRYQQVPVPLCCNFCNFCHHIHVSHQCWFLYHLQHTLPTPGRVESFSSFLTPCTV